MSSNLIFFNHYFDKNRLKALILWTLTKSGEKTTIDLVEKLKDFGFHYATQAGLSLGIDDLKIPPTKSELILEAEIFIQNSQKEFELGNLTVIEKFQQIIDVWHRTSEILKQNVVQHFRSTDVLNPVYMMAFSGARGNISQVRQLVGMRGLMADPQGQILDFPIRSNFREGLTLTEYVISCYGARKGLVDTALRTANSGYLTRRLVDVAQHIIVKQLNCGTKKGIIISEMRNGKKIIFPLQKRLIGRVLAESIENIANKNEAISPKLALKITKLKKTVLVRSPLSCEAKYSICQLCYGWSLAHGSLVSLGEAVGILAAQSIGEPGTQLTMRTFHTGGVFSGDVMQEIRSSFDGYVKFNNPLQGLLIRTLHGKIAFLTKVEGELYIYNSENKLKSTYHIPLSTVLFIRESEFVKKRQLLAEYSSMVTKNNQGIQANYNINSTLEGEMYFEDVVLIVKSGKEGDIIKTALKFGSIWVLSGKLYQSAIRSTLFVKRSDLVDTTSILNQSLFVTPYNGYLEQFSQKRIFKFLNKKSTDVFNENSFFKKILSNERNFSFNDLQLNSQNNLQKEYTEIHFNQDFLHIYFQDIYYKKFGYFVKLLNAKGDTLFLRTSLKENNFIINKKNLHWLTNEKSGGEGKLYFDSHIITKQTGQIYLLPELFYKIPLTKISQNFTVKPKSFYFHLIEQEKPVWFIKNNQGNRKFLYSTAAGLFESLENHYEIKNENYSLIPKKTNFEYVKNQKLQLLKEITVRKLVRYKKKTFTNLSIPYSFRINKTKIRKSLNFYKKFNTTTKFFDITEKQSSNFRKSNDEKKNFSIVELQTGWVCIPSNKFETIELNKKILLPISQRTNYHFDQNYIYQRYFPTNNLFFFFIKTTRFLKIRYINNKFFRYNKNRNSLLEKEKKSTNFSVSFLINKNLFVLKAILNNFHSLKINRNKVYQNNLKNKIFFLLKIEKTVELKMFNQLEEKKEFKNSINNKLSFNFSELRRFSFNKQKSSNYKNPSYSIDVKIQNNKINLTEKRKTLILNQKKISFSFPKNFAFIYGKLKLTNNQSLKFLSSKKLKSFNSQVKNNFKTSKDRVFVSSTNNVFEKNILTSNSFFSPYAGEITTVKTDLTGIEKSLLLTNADKTSFSIDQANLIVQIGQVIRYGDQVEKNKTLSESGQIIQIDKKKITLRKAKPILFSSQGVFHIDNGDIIEKNSPVITLFYQKLKTEDIVQGIPKIEEIFEARQTKEGEQLQENLHTKLQLLFNFYKKKYTSQKAARRSIEKIQQILVNNVQKVYQSQGVSIADKHIEIIVRQMTTKVKITESGRTGLLRGELTDLEWVEIINLGIEAQNKITNQGVEVEKAEYEPIILGITKSALETESFISASSFQETTRILSRAAIERKTDFLRGLKENVILGHLIPAGTGFSLSFDCKDTNGINIKKINWVSYKEIMTTFSKTKN